MRLLSLQHWSKQMKDMAPTSGTGCETVHNEVTLFWNQRENKLTVPIGKSNITTFQLAPCYGKCTAFCAEVKVNCEKEQDDSITIELSQLVSEDDEEDDDNADAGSDEPNETNWCEPVGSQFHLDGQTTQGKYTPNTVEDEED